MIVAGSLAAPAVARAADAAPAAKLNLVFIMADDLGWGELGCYGQQKIPTPNIDRLAAEGTRFTRHYCGAPVCAPSRCVLMTGKHTGHAEVRGNQQAKVHFPQFTEGQHPLSNEAVTWAQLFQCAGYATGAMGKWGLGPVGSTGEPSRKGFDLFFGYNCQAVAHSYYPKYLWRNAEQVLINSMPIDAHPKPATGEVRMENYLGESYSPNLMIAEAEKFITANAGRPFFLYLPFIEPHVAMHPPRERVEQFPTAWDSEVYRGECGYLPHPRPRAAYAAMIAELDGYVGRVMAALKQAGVAERTLVIFTSDNGTTHAGPPNTRFNIGGVDADFFNSTAGLRGYKGSVYEGGIRIPLIVRLPGKVKAGATSDALGYFADWFPTLCDAFGFQTPSGLDGQSLWPVITDTALYAPHKPLVWVFPEYGGQVAVRMGDLKVLRRDLKTKKPGAWEVYDLASDPGEQHDLAATRADAIAEAQQVLRSQVADNSHFPLLIPGVNAAAN